MHTGEGPIPETPSAGEDRSGNHGALTAVFSNYHGTMILAPWQATVPLFGLLRFRPMKPKYYANAFRYCRLKNQSDWELIDETSSRKSLGARALADQPSK